MFTNNCDPVMDIVEMWVYQLSSWKQKLVNFVSMKLMRILQQLQWVDWNVNENQENSRVSWFKANTQLFSTEDVVCDVNWLLEKGVFILPSLYFHVEGNE